MIQAMRSDMGFWRSAYDEHSPAVLAFLQRRLGRREEAEDLLQETFVRAIRSGSFAEGGNLRGYLLRIAHNLMVNRLRRPRLVVPAARDEEGGDRLEEAPAGDASPEEEAAWSGFRRDLGRVLAGMSEAHRCAFELAVLEGQSYGEVAAAMGWSLAQVKINVYRARRKVIEELYEHLPQAGRSMP